MTFYIRNENVRREGIGERNPPFISCVNIEASWEENVWEKGVGPRRLGLVVVVSTTIRVVFPVSKVLVLLRSANADLSFRPLYLPLLVKREREGEGRSLGPVWEEDPSNSTTTP